MSVKDPRLSQILPVIRCSDCGHDVEFRLLGEHICSSAPAMPALPVLPLSKRTFSIYYRSHPRSLCSLISLNIRFFLVLQLRGALLHSGHTRQQHTQYKHPIWEFGVSVEKGLRTLPKRQTQSHAGRIGLRSKETRTRIYTQTKERNGGPIIEMGFVFQEQPPGRQRTKGDDGGHCR